MGGGGRVRGGVGGVRVDVNGEVTPGWGVRMDVIGEVKFL